MRTKVNAEQAVREQAALDALMDLMLIALLSTYWRKPIGWAVQNLPMGVGRFAPMI